MIDTHAHIYLKEFSNDFDETMDRAIHAGVEKVYMPNIDHTTIDDMLEIEMSYDHCISMMGLHPCSVKQGFEKELYLVEEWLEKRDFAAVGEIGTDLYWDKTFWSYQQEAFKVQVGFAKKHKLPIVIHCRESIDETIAMVEDLKDDGLSGVFHCFTGSLDQANKIISLGFYLGIGGVSTFKNGGMDKLLPEIPLNHLVLETDSPYLAPVPHRGKRNEPSYIGKIALRVAELQNVSLEKVKTQTTINAQKLFESSEV